MATPIPAPAPGDEPVRKLRVAWSVLWRIVLFFLLWGLLLTPFLVGAATVLARWEHERPLLARLYGDVAAAITILAATWITARLADRRRLAWVGLNRRRAKIQALAGLGLGALWLGISLGACWRAGWLTPAPGGALAPGPAAALAGIMLLNVVAQQLLLNGYLFRTLETRAGADAAVLISAALFTAYHAGAFGGAWLPAVNVFLAGIVFCLARLLTGALWLPLGMHFAWNYVLGPILGLTVSGLRAWSGQPLLTLRGPALYTGGEFGLEGGLIVTVVTGLLGGALLLFVRRQRRLSAEERSSET